MNDTNRNATYVDVIIDALNQLGGHAYLKDIYDMAKMRGLRAFPQSYDASIRAAIEAHSSDSRVYKGGLTCFTALVASEVGTGVCVSLTL